MFLSKILCTIARVAIDTRFNANFDCSYKFELVFLGKKKLVKEGLDVAREVLTPRTMCLGALFVIGSLQLSGKLRGPQIETNSKKGMSGM